MTGDEAARPGNTCERCGTGELRLVAGRIAKLTEPGHMNIFQCSACGLFENRDIPHQPPGKRT